MCLYITDRQSEQVAKKDILVFKIIYKNNESFVRSFRYEPNKLYRLRKKLTPRFVGDYYSIIRYKSINVGFHSYNTLQVASKHHSCYIPDYEVRVRIKIVKMIIPKGAKYYVSHDGEGLVSSSIKTLDLVKCKEIL